MLLAPFGRWQRIRVAPQAAPRVPRFELYPFVGQPIGWGLLARVFPVPPREPVPHLFETDVALADIDGADLAPVTVVLAAVRRHPFPEGELGEARLGRLAERLCLLGGVDPGDPDPMLCLRSVEDGECVPVLDRDDESFDVMTVRCRRQPKRRGKRGGTT